MKNKELSTQVIRMLNMTIKSRIGKNKKDDFNYPCMVETRQEYEHFSRKDVVRLIKVLGKISNHLYSQYHRYNVGGIADKLDDKQKHYFWALQDLMAFIATFYQYDYKHFTDLHSRIKKSYGL